MGLCTHVDHKLYKYTLGSEQDVSSPTELSSLFEPPPSAALQQLAEADVGLYSGKIKGMGN